MKLPAQQEELLPTGREKVQGIFMHPGGERFVYCHRNAIVYGDKAPARLPVVPEEGRGK